MQASEMGNSDYSPPIGPDHDLPERRLGLFDFLCLGWNCVIGSGIFSTQGAIVAQVGALGPAMFLVGGLFCLPVALCFSHLAQRFHGTGGSSLYAREAFGPRTGFLVGWVMWQSGLIGLATVATLLAEFMHLANPQLTACGIVLTLAALNLLGSRSGSWANNILAVVKLLPLLLAMTVGLAQVGFSETMWPTMAPLAVPNYKMGLLLVLYTYSGFEEIVLPAGEARSPEKTVPRATILVLATSALCYTILQGVVSSRGTAGAEQPLAAALPPLAGALTVAAAASFASVNASIAFTTPRSLWTLADQGWLPSPLLRLHRGAPILCILISSALTIALLLSRNASALIALSVLAALMQHLAASLACWKLGLARWAPLFGVATCLLLLCTSDVKDLVGMAVSLLVGAVASVTFGRAKVDSI